MEQRSGSIQLDVPDFSNSVLVQLNQLRVQGRLCDIVVQVQGRSFRAHKVVLAASSPYFRDHMALGQMSTVSLALIRNAGVFEQLLGFCYTGRLRLQPCDIISCLTAASFLQMQQVIDRCTSILEGIHLQISLTRLGPGGEEEEEGEEPAQPPQAPPLQAVERWYRSSQQGGTAEQRVKTEWMEEEEEEEDEEEGKTRTGRVEEEEQEVGGATVVIDSSGRSSLLPLQAAGRNCSSAAQPSSSYSETDRWVEPPD